MGRLISRIEQKKGNKDEKAQHRRVDGRLRTEQAMDMNSLDSTSLRALRQITSSRHPTCVKRNKTSQAKCSCDLSQRGRVVLGTGQQAAEADGSACCEC